MKNNITISIEFRNLIIKNFSDKLSSSSKLYAYLKKIKNTQLYNQIEKVFQQYKEYFLKISNLIIWVINNEQLTYCLACKKLLNYQKRKNTFCSVKCAQNYQQTKIQIKNTNIKKYGVHHTQTKQWKQKVNKTCLEKFGTINPNLSKQVKQKIKNTNLQKYGVENPFQNQLIKQKIKNTNIKKYGYENPMQNQLIKQKAINNKTGIIIRKTVKTEQEKQQIIQKRRITNIQKYNQAIPIQITQARYKQAWETILSWNKYIIPLFSYNDYIGYKHLYQWKCQLCGNTFKIHIHGTGHIKEKGYEYMPRCLKCFPIYCGYSQLEKQLVQFCKQYYPNLIENDRNLIKPYQLDIVIPEIKLAIEFNGIFWHSTAGFYQKNYHLMKTQLCQYKNYRLIHIWQDQWINNTDIIKNRLIQVFNNTQNIPINTWLDRSWFSTLNYNNIQIKQPQIIKRKKFLVENCGYFKIKS